MRRLTGTPVLLVDKFSNHCRRRRGEHARFKTGQNLRYVRDTSQQRTAQRFPDSVDLEHLRDRVKAVLDFLGGCAGEFESNAESHREYE